MFGFIKRMLIAPLLLASPVMSALEDDIDYDALGRMVDSRIARAERGVLRDYFAQHGLEGDDAAQAEERYRELRKASHPDADTVRQLEQRCARAETRARTVSADSAAKVCMARMGVPDDCADDVLVLARRQLERDGTALPDDPSLASESIRKAVEAVLSRMPMLASGAVKNAAGINSGSIGSFPRNEGGQDVLQRQLDSLRASGDTVSSVALINAAAEKGIILR